MSDIRVRRSHVICAMLLYTGINWVAPALAADTASFKELSSKIENTSDVAALGDALASLQKLADVGDIAAMLYISKLYEDGVEGKVKRNPEAALNYLRKASEAKSSVASARLASIYLRGEIVPQDKVLSEKYLKTASKSNDAVTLRTLGDLFSTGDHGFLDGRKAIEFYTRSAKAGNTFSYIRIGDIYRDGKLTEKDLAKAFANYKLAADSGVATAQVRVANALMRGEGTIADPAGAETVLLKIDTNTNGTKEFALGELYSRYALGKLDGRRALSEYQESLKLGNVSAWVRIGDLYRDGTLVPVDLTKAKEAFENASKADIVLGQVRMAQLLMAQPTSDADLQRAESILKQVAVRDPQGGNLVLGDFYARCSKPLDGEKAAQHYKLSMDAGNPWAALRLGVLLDDGELVPKDTASAFRAFEAASLAGVMPAKAWLGEAYVLGTGVDVDVPKGTLLLTQAADAGVAKAQLVLAELLLKDTDAQAHVTAIKYLKMASEAGFGRANLMLGDLYRDGTLVPADPDLAYNYYSKAATSGVTTARLRLGEAYLIGRGVDPDIEKGLILLKDAADTQKSASSLKLLGDYLSRGEYVGRNPAAAVDAYANAARLGSASAAYRLGEIYRDGVLVPKQPALAIENFEQAARNGYTRAAAALAEGHAKGLFGKLSKSRTGLKNLEALAKTGDLDALLIVADRQYWGRDGTRPDPQHALKLLDGASKEGHVRATRKLIALYRDAPGERIKRSVTKAERIIEERGSQLDAGSLASERILIKAATASSVRGYEDINKLLSNAPPSVLLDTLVMLRNANPNAFVYFSQAQMKKKGLYKGAANGLLTAATIRSINKLCRSGVNGEVCGKGPLHYEAVRAISVLVDPSRRN